ncbi:protein STRICTOSIDINE SYNTHASE-LIKE 10-like [Chenopodium quinoa]|uniref:Strictosidine synthase conserved region domain-containing protein n=1 Tax=Chenopodium quinoa TaxID=63459 RepID=A0A803LCI9_CHEQI|nr:protein STRICTOSIDINE SYNTHASE-LIKE 10-like [Chenopodium quinoa]
MKLQCTIWVFLFIQLISKIFQAQAIFPFTGHEVGSQPRTRHYHRLPLGLNAVGPESIAFDCQGTGPYVGVSDGRILKWEGRSWTVFAITNSNRSKLCDGTNNSPNEQTCGRPLGLKFDMVTCELYIVDSSYGLVKVNRNGGVAVSLATSAEEIPFKFLNDLDIDSENGVVYFTDTSSTYHRWEYPMAIATFERSGRLIKYDMKTKALTVLLRDLYFANGVALSKNKDFILVTETSACRVLKYWLKGPKAGINEIFLQLTGLPDNINRNINGEFWIAKNPTKPIRVDESGMILESLDTFEIADSSEVTEIHGNLWIASVNQPYVIYTT